MIDRRTLLVSLAVFGLPRATAAEPPYRVRLFGGERDGDVWMAGIDVNLDDGWKTYWRVPGDAGIPPSFEWSGSRGAKAIEVLFPAPHRLADGSGEVIGYKTRVVFPVRVTAEDADVALDLKMFFGVCKDVCIPARFAGALTAAEPSPADLSLIQTFMARVPRKEKFVTAARIAAGALTVTLSPEAPTDPDLFVESDTLAYFRAPQVKDGGHALPIDGLKDVMSLRGKTLRVTLVAGDHRLEQDVIVE